MSKSARAEAKRRYPSESVPAYKPLVEAFEEGATWNASWIVLHIQRLIRAEERAEPKRGDAAGRALQFAVISELEALRDFIAERAEVLSEQER